MKDTMKGKSYVWVRDEADREFLCPIDALKDPADADETELTNCINVAATEEKVGKR